MLDGTAGPQMLDWARRIEADGYATVGFGERVAYHNLDMHTALTAAAAVTERVAIASTVVVLPMQSEVAVAKQAATLDVLSGGRYVLGVGVGGRSEDYRAVGGSFERRWARLDQQIGRIRRLWAGEEIGEGLGPLGPLPIQEAVPVFSGSMGPKATARAAVWADGIMGFVTDPSPDALGGAALAATRAWTDARRNVAPRMWTSWWFALGEGAAERLRAYAMSYLGVFGPELAGALADSCSVSSEDALLRGLEAAQTAGYEEVQLVPTTADLAELDRLAAVISRFR